MARRLVHFLGIFSLLAALGCERESPARAGNIQVRLLSDQDAVVPGRPFHVGLHMKIRRGWHTYWKNPGDAGIPVRATWKLPEGYRAGPIEWPAPDRFRENAVTAYGYSHDVILPVEITPPPSVAMHSRRGSSPDSVTITGTIDWLECAEVCLPGSKTVSLTLPVVQGPAKPSADAQRIAVARARVPASPSGWKLSAESGPRAVALTFMPPARVSARRGYLFAEQPLVVDHSAPQGFERLRTGYRLTAPPAPNAPARVARLKGVLVVEGDVGSRSRSAVQIDVPVEAGDPALISIPSSRPRLPLLAIILALLGLTLLLPRFIRRSSTSNLNRLGEKS